MTEHADRASNFSDYQLSIYAQGMFADQPPAFTTNLAELESQAAEILEPEALGYIVPSAGNSSTMRANRTALERWRIVPRMLRGSAQRTYDSTVLGTKMAAPVLIAPVGVQKLAHPDGELATARAATSVGLTYVHSTQASHSIEQVADASGDGNRWYQFYWPTDRDVAVSLLQRARAAGYTTLVVTLDTVLLGWRPRDLDRGYLPFLASIGIDNYLTDPAFCAGLTKPVDEDPVAAVMHWAQMFPNPSLSWDQLPFLREHWDGPIVLKGIQSVADAKLTVTHEMDGIVVSNHGGRQVDGAVGSLDVLPDIADAVGDRLTVLFDSGIRTGSDVFKAIALGADAVLLGRPFLYGLALGGQTGVEHVLRCLLAELDLTVALAGYPGTAALSRDAVTRP